MSNLRQSFQSQLEAAGVPINQAAAAADALARQSDGELPVPLPPNTPEQAAVTSAWHWMSAQKESHPTKRSSSGVRLGH